MTNIDHLTVEASAVRADVRRRLVFLLLIGIAAVLRIYAISFYPLAGDEYGSIAEAESLGLNWNSIIYSSLMHFWIRLGTGELWLRLPAAIFGTAAVVILFKTGEKLGGWRTGVVAGLLAATSPFNIYHSQEVRFYSLFMCASAAFMLATVHYVDSRRAARNRMGLLVAGVALVLSHFLGVLAVYAQGAATALAAKSRWSKRTLLLVLFGLPAVAYGLLLVPAVRQALWRLYQIYGNGSGSSEPVTTSVSIVNFMKAAFAGFVFIFGYHVYPLRLVLVIAGTCLTGVLLVAGARRLWKETRWGVLALAYLLALLSVYVVLDSVGGRVAAGVSPRHVAFIWPAFLILVAIGLASFNRSVFQILLVAALAINGLSIWSGWQKDWTYGAAPDYRSAAEYASRRLGKDSAVIHDGRSANAINFYFPKGAPFINAWMYQQNHDLTQLAYQRLIFVTDDWRPDRRRGFDRLLSSLRESYLVVDGRVDYPLFEYAMERKSSSESSGYALRGENNQLHQPLSFYGLEFQDLRLPVSVKVKEVPLTVIGAYGLPDFEGRRELTIPLACPTDARRVVLLTDIVDASGLQPGQQIAALAVESKTGKTTTLPLRLDQETASWDKQCELTAPCGTVFQWHKRMAVVSQNSYDGALRDFPAGLHGVVLDFPEQLEVIGLTIRYTANSGRLYVWGMALPNNQ